MYGRLHRIVYGVPAPHAAQNDLRSREEAGEPYTKIVGELAEMRRDTVNLVNQSIEETRQAYVVVNNRSEGNAPLTVQALVERRHTDP